MGVSKNIFLDPHPYTKMFLDPDPYTNFFRPPPFHKNSMVHHPSSYFFSKWPALNQLWGNIKFFLEDEKI